VIWLRERDGGQRQPRVWAYTRRYVPCQLFFGFADAWRSAPERDKDSPYMNHVMPYVLNLVILDSYRGGAENAKSNQLREVAMKQQTLIIVSA
jgi:hypothetical protein